MGYFSMGIPLEKVVFFTLVILALFLALFIPPITANNRSFDVLKHEQKEP